MTVHKTVRQDHPTVSPKHPRGWAATTIGDIAETSSGFGFPEKFQGRTFGKFPFAKVRDISFAFKNTNGRLSAADNFVDQDVLQALKARPVRAGSTVFAKIGEALRLNRRVVLDVDAVLDNNCMAVTPDVRVANAEFVYRFLTTVDLSPFAVATTVPSVRRGDVTGILFHLPPLPEQHRIITKIESLSANSKRARDHLDHIPRLVEKYKQALLANIFGMGNEDGLTALSEVIASTFYGPRFAKEAYDSAGVITLRTTDFDDGGHIKLKSPPAVRVSEVEFAKWGRTKQSIRRAVDRRPADISW